MKKIAILGATGVVGQELLSILEEREFPVSQLKLLASVRSAGKIFSFKGEKQTVEELTHDSFQGIDIVLSSAGGTLSKEFVPSAVKTGAIVIDNTSYFRLDPTVPLVIPEINPEAIKMHQGIIANPNCSTILMLLPLWPLHKKFGIKRVVVSTYQAASGAGAKAMEELLEESKSYLTGNTFQPTVIPHPYAFNLFPHNSPMKDNGYCEEELKMIYETRKIFADDNFKVSATCVRVPILRAHSESVNVEFDKPVTVKEVYESFSHASGVEVLEDRNNNRWPMPLDASTKDPVYVGRVRQDLSKENAIEFWLTGDQIRKGAALNAVQIAELL